MVEQWTEDPRVTSSNLVPGIPIIIIIIFFISTIIMFRLSFSKINFYKDLKVKRIFRLLTLFSILFLGFPRTSSANIGILVDCDKSPAFTKRLNSSIKKLENRLAKYDAGTPPALALQEQITHTKSRFMRYGDSDVLCGTDGLPHLVVDGDLNHASEFIIPGFLFIYITGWIGWVGRKYVQTVSKLKNPMEKEIILDVPLALNIMFSGYLWPFLAWNEFTSGNFVAQPEDITVSPR